MSRHQITVRGQGVADADAIIGYDPPLRTYFLQPSRILRQRNLACGSVQGWRSFPIFPR